MARPCEYDEERALDAALLVFWQRGFGGTSISDLESATSMKRQSLYNAFGDKQELYARALARYREKSLAMFAPLRSEDAGLAELEKMILANLALQKKNDCGGCMAVKAAFDQQIEDPEAKKLAAELAQTTRDLYRDVLARAQSRGEVTAGADPTALAQYVFSVANGLSALAQTGGTQRELERTLEMALSGLRSGPSRRRPPSRPTNSSPRRIPTRRAR